MSDIIVAGYPKSGTTWLTRLLGDVLDSPTGGSIASEDANEVATEGQERPGPYVVRKGHYRLVDNDSGPVIPTKHQFAWKRWTDEKVVFLVRDPRDIAVSGAAYFDQPVPEFLERMLAGQLFNLPAWGEYVEGWLDLLHIARFVKYEDLLAGPEVVIANLLRSYIDHDYWLDHDPARIPGAVERQSFASRLHDYDGPHPDQHRAIMRHGRAGEWVDHFDAKMIEAVRAAWGGTMKALGYV